MSSTKEKQILLVEDLELFDPLKKKLLTGLNFEVLPGEALHIIGENGTGKTALIRSIFAGYKYFKGKIKLSLKDFAYLPQLSPKRPKLPISLEEICPKEYPFYSQDTMKRPLAGASGGERKRAMLAKVFSEDKKLIVLDEPLNHLDSGAQEQVAKWLTGYIQGGGTLIYTGHIGNLPHTKTLDLEKWKC